MKRGKKTRYPKYYYTYIGADTGMERLAFASDGLKKKKLNTINEIADDLKWARLPELNGTIPTEPIIL